MADLLVAQKDNLLKRCNEAASEDTSEGFLVKARLILTLMEFVLPIWLDVSYGYKTVDICVRLINDVDDFIDMTDKKKQPVTYSKLIVLKADLNELRVRARFADSTVRYAESSKIRV